MDEPQETPDELMRKISDADQLTSSIVGIARMTALLLRQLQEEGLTREEAFELAQAWLVALVSRMRPDS